MSDELLEKVIVSTEIGNPFGAGLKRDQADRFIDYMWDATVLGRQVRREKITGNDIELQKVGVGEGLIRAAQEAVDTGENVGVVWSRISIRTAKIRLDYEVSRETLEDNIEGAGLEDHLARLFATQMGNDLENLAINGDTSSSNPALRIFNGWRKVLLEGGDGTGSNPLTEGAAHVVDAGGANVSREAFHRALKAMPRKFMNNRPALKFFTGSGVIGDYQYSLTAVDFPQTNAAGASIIANGAVRTEGPAGFTTGLAFGVPIQEVPYFDETKDGTYSGAGTKDHGDIWLLDPRNLIWVVKREIEIFREFIIKKDTYEFTIFCRVGLGVENSDAVCVIVNNAVQL